MTPGMLLNGEREGKGLLVTKRALKKAYLFALSAMRGIVRRERKG